MLTDEATPRVVLVDYDQVRWRGLWGQLYYAVCYLLFLRDLAWLNGRHSDQGQSCKHDLEWRRSAQTQKC